MCNVLAREQHVQFQTGVFIRAAFHDVLLEKVLHLRVQADGAIEHRIAACGVGTDADQITVTLEAGQQLFEISYAGNTGRRRLSDVMARLIDASISMAG